MSKSSLRAVGPGERRAEPMSASEAAESGTRLDEYRAMRRVIARAIDSEATSPRDLAALTRRLDELRKQIAAERARLREEAKDAEHIPDEAWDEAAI